MLKLLHANHATAKKRHLTHKTSSTLKSKCINPTTEDTDGGDEVDRGPIQSRGMYHAN